MLDMIDNKPVCCGIRGEEFDRLDSLGLNFVNIFLVIICVNVSYRFTGRVATTVELAKIIYIYILMHI